MTRSVAAWILLRLIASALILLVAWRTGSGVRLDRIRKSCDSVSNEFLPIDEVVRLLDGLESATGTVAYVVEDAANLDGLDRAAFAAVAFRVLPQRLALVDYSCENLTSDYVLIGNYSSERDRLVGAQTEYVEIGRTSSTSLFAKNSKTLVELCRVNDCFDWLYIVRQSVVAVLLIVLVCVLFVRLSGVKVELGAGWWFAFISVAVTLAFGCLLTHTLRSPNGTAVYAGKAKLMYLTGGIPSDLFTHEDWRVFLPTYPIGLTVLAYIYYVFAGRCDNWIVQLVAYSGVVAALLLVFNSSKTVIGRLLALLFFVSVGTKQIGAGFYAEGFVAAFIIAAMMRMNSGRGDSIVWGIAGCAALFKNEGVLFYGLLCFSAFVCGVRRLCKPLAVVAGILPALAWYAVVRMVGGSLDGYALNGIFESFRHVGVAVFEMGACIAWDWDGGVVVIPVFLVCGALTRMFLRRSLKDSDAVLPVFVSMSLVAILAVYCFCSPSQIRWRIHSSCFRLLWTVAAVSLYGMTMMERPFMMLLRTKCRILKTGWLIK